MGKKRVYEAARRLNLETSELMKLLQEQGVTVKSPISFISEDDFENVSNSLVTPQGKPLQEVEAGEPTPDTATVGEHMEAAEAEPEESTESENRAE